MGTLEIAAIVAAFVAVGIGILAIWLSVQFYKMSQESAESTRESANRIASSVERLEGLFDRLYADTFSMVKDTMTDMRHHIMPGQERTGGELEKEVEKKVETKLKEYKKSIESDFNQLVSKQIQTDSKVDLKSKEWEVLFAEAFNNMKNISNSAREETIRDHIINFLKTHELPIKAGLFFDQMEQLRPSLTHPDIAKELFRMREEGIVSWRGPESKLPHSSVLTLKEQE